MIKWLVIRHLIGVLSSHFSVAFVDSESLTVMCHGYVLFINIIWSSRLFPLPVLWSLRVSTGSVLAKFDSTILRNHFAWRYLNIPSIKTKTIIYFLIFPLFYMFSKFFFLRIPCLFTHLPAHQPFEWSFRTDIPLFLQVFGICSSNTVVYWLFPIDKRVPFLSLVLGLSLCVDRNGKNFWIGNSRKWFLFYLGRSLKCLRFRSL
jgi:hypothetical protein